MNKRNNHKSAFKALHNAVLHIKLSALLGYQDAVLQTRRKLDTPLNHQLMLEELLAKGISEAEYDAHLIRIGEGEQFGSGQGPYGNLGDLEKIGGHEQGFEPGKVIDHEDDILVRYIFHIVQPDIGPGKILQGLDGKSGGSVGESIHVKT